MHTAKTTTPHYQKFASHREEGGADGRLGLLILKLVRVRVRARARVRVKVRLGCVFSVGVESGAEELPAPGEGRVCGTTEY